MRNIKFETLREKTKNIIRFEIRKETLPESRKRKRNDACRHENKIVRVSRDRNGYILNCL